MIRHQQITKLDSDFVQKKLQTHFLYPINVFTLHIDTFGVFYYVLTRAKNAKKMKFFQLLGPV